MILPVNPYCLFPFYLGYVDRATRGPLYSPTEKAPHFQFYVPGTYSAVDTFAIYNPVTGLSTSLFPSLIEEADNDGDGTFYTYKGTTLTAPLASGQLQQLVVTLANGDAYYSHALCPFAGFDSDIAGLTKLSCTNPSSGVFTINLSAGIPAGTGYRVRVSDENSSAVMTVNSEFAISNGFATAVLGGFSIRIEVRCILQSPAGPYINITKTYRLTFTSAAPCTTTITLLSTTNDYGENMHLLRSTNGANDRPEFPIMHQTGFIQELYFAGFDELPTPVREESYTENSDGAPIFTGATSRQSYTLSFYPCPDPLLTAFSALRSASGTTITTFGQPAMIAERISLGVSPVEGDNVSVGAMTWEMDSNRLARCNDDLTITVL